jgi:hypothetical protein
MARGDKLHGITDPNSTVNRMKRVERTLRGEKSHRGTGKTIEGQDQGVSNVPVVHIEDISPVLVDDYTPSGQYAPFLRVNITNGDYQQTRSFIGFEVRVIPAIGAVFTQRGPAYPYDPAHGIPGPTPIDIRTMPTPPREQETWKVQVRVLTGLWGAGFWSDEKPVSWGGDAIAPAIPTWPLDWLVQNTYNWDAHETLVEVKWQAGLNAGGVVDPDLDRFVIRVSVDGLSDTDPNKVWDEKPSVAATDLSYQFHDLDPGVQADFEVRAQDTSGNQSGWSQTRSVTVFAPNAPAAPTNLQITTNFYASRSHVSVIGVAWDAVTSPGLAGYHLVIVEDGVQRTVDVGLVTEAVFNVAPGVTFSAVVKARNLERVFSADSNQVSGVGSLTDDPLPPQNVTPAWEYNGFQTVALTLAWERPSDLQGVVDHYLFEVYPAGATSNAWWTGQFPADVLTTVVTLPYPLGFVLGNQYDVYYRSVSQYGDAGTRPMTRVTASQDNLLRPPVGGLTFQAKGTDSAGAWIQVSFTESVDPHHDYEIQYWATDEETSKLSVGTLGSPYKVRGLRGDKVYALHIRTSDQFGNDGPWSDDPPYSYPNLVVDLRDVGPAPPSGFTLGSNVYDDALGKAVLSLSWTASIGPRLAGYTLRIVEAGVERFQTVGVVTSAQVFVEPEAAFSLYITAVDDMNGTSTEVGPVSGTGAIAPLPPAPDFDSFSEYGYLTSTSGYVVASWLYSNGIPPFVEYQYRLDGQTWDKTIPIQRVDTQDGTVSQARVENLLLDTKYWFRFRGADSHSRVSAWSIDYDTFIPGLGAGVLANPDFEIPDPTDGSRPKDWGVELLNNMGVWEPNILGTADWFRDTAQAANGLASLRGYVPAQGDFIAIWSNLIPCASNSTWFLEFQAKADVANAGQLVVTVVFYMADGRTPVGAVPGGTINVTTAWQPYLLTTPFDSSSGAYYARARFGFRKQAGDLATNLYVDSVRFAPRITGNNLHPQMDVITTTFQAADAAQTPLIVKGAAGQTAPHFEVRNNLDEGLFSVDENGVPYAARIVTTGNNTVNKSDASVADLVLGSNLGGGFRHGANVLMWNNIGALRLVANDDDSLSLSSYAAFTDGTVLPGAAGGNAILTGPVAVHKSAAPGCSLDVAGWSRFGAGTDIPTGDINAIEVFFYAPAGWGGMLAYNRGTNTYLPMHIEAASIDLYISSKPTFSLAAASATFANNTTPSIGMPINVFGLPASGGAVGIGQVLFEFASATAASWKSRTRLMVQGAGGTLEALRLEHSGSAPLLGFFGVPAVARQTGGAAIAGTSYTSNEQTMLNRVYAAMRNLGLLT